MLRSIYTRVRQTVTWPGEEFHVKIFQSTEPGCVTHFATYLYAIIKSERWERYNLRLSYDQQETSPMLSSKICNGTFTVYLYFKSLWKNMASFSSILKNIVPIKKNRNCPEWGSNSRPWDYETHALPTAPSRPSVAEDGFDPSTSGLWAQHASAAPLCCVNTAKTWRVQSLFRPLILINRIIFRLICSRR